MLATIDAASTDMRTHGISRFSVTESKIYLSMAALCQKRTSINDQTGIQNILPVADRAPGT